MPKQLFKIYLDEDLIIIEGQERSLSKASAIVSIDSVTYVLYNPVSCHKS